MAASDERLIVAVKDELRALDASTGAVVWTDRPGPLTAPPLVHGEWLLVASGEQVIGYRVLDGTRVWSRETGVVEQRPAVAGTRVYVPAADGRIVALELASGEPVWEFDVGIRPTEPLVYGDRLFVGSAAKRLCSLFLDVRPRREDWCFNDLGAVIVGRPAADETHVYFASLDNLLRAHDRKNGAYRWKKDLKYRPSAGPLLVGKSLAVPGSVPRVDVFDTAKGDTTLQLTLATKLATEPLLLDPVETTPARIVAVTGGLAQGVERHPGRSGAGHAAGAQDRAAHGTAGAGDPDWQAACSSRTVAASRRTPSSIRAGVGAENDSRMKCRPLPLTKNACPAT